MKLSTHQLAHILLAQKDQPVYTCDYAGPEGDLTMYPVVCVDSNIIQDGTIICTGEEGIPYHQFVPVVPEDDGPLTAKQIEAIRMMSTATNTPDSAFGKALM